MNFFQKLLYQYYVITLLMGFLRRTTKLAPSKPTGKPATTTPVPVSSSTEEVEGDWTGRAKGKKYFNKFKSF